MGRLEFLKDTITSMVSQPETQLVVVDYSCPQRTGDWVESRYPQVTVVRESGCSFYHGSRSRNLGARAARTPWLFFVDADVRLDDALVAGLLPKLNPNHTYHATPWRPGSMGTFLCHRDAFEKVGGYDEHFRGWGDEDRDIITRFRMAGFLPRGFSSDLISVTTHGDDLRTANQEVKDRDRSFAINRSYATVKHDLMRLNEGKAPETDKLASLYETVAQAIDTAVEQGEPIELAIPAGKRVQPTGWSTNLVLRYRIAPPTR